MKMVKAITIAMVAFAAAAAANAGSIMSVATDIKAKLSGDVYDTALAAAKSGNKKVMLLFSGLEWCLPCQVFNKEVVKNADFEKFAKDSLVFVEFDTKRDGTVDITSNTPEVTNLDLFAEQRVIQKSSIQKKFGVYSVPCAIILDKDGKEMFRQVGCGITAEDFIDKVKNAK